MRFSRARSGIAGLAAVAAAVLSIGAPAEAQRADADVTMYLFDISVPAGGRGAAVRPYWSATSPVRVAEPRLTYTLSGLDGVKLVTEPNPGGAGGQCENISPTRVSCSDDYVLNVDTEPSWSSFVITAEADATAEIGKAGTLTATFTGEGVAPITKTARMRVAESVDLDAGDPIEIRSKPGRPVDVGFNVSNRGTTTVDTASVVVSGDYALQATGNYRNCRYAQARVLSCTFDQELAPGAAYRLSLPYKVRKDTLAPSQPQVDLTWLTGAELEDYHAALRSQGVPIGKPGTGGTLKLSQVASALAQPEADGVYFDNGDSQTVFVDGKNPADISAVGDKVTGETGDEVVVTVGVANRGPATIDDDSTIAYIEATMPAGTSVITAPERCRKNDDGYLCYAEGFLRAGQQETFDFKLRIDSVGAPGTVTVRRPCECWHIPTDRDPSNNTAQLVIAAPSTAGGGGGGGLAVTGPGGFVFGGLALLAGGGVVFLIARRRTRFVA